MTPVISTVSLLDRQPRASYETGVKSDRYVTLVQVCLTVLGPRKYPRSTTTQPWYCGGPQTLWLPAHILWRGEQRVSTY